MKFPPPASLEGTSSISAGISKRIQQTPDKSSKHANYSGPWMLHRARLWCLCLSSGWALSQCGKPAWHTIPKSLWANILGGCCLTLSSVVDGRKRLGGEVRFVHLAPPSPRFHDGSATQIAPTRPEPRVHVQMPRNPSLHPRRDWSAGKRRSSCPRPPSEFGSKNLGRPRSNQALEQRETHVTKSMALCLSLGEMADPAAIT